MEGIKHYFPQPSPPKHTKLVQKSLGTLLWPSAVEGSNSRPAVFACTWVTASLLVRRPQLIQCLSLSKIWKYGHQPCFSPWRGLATMAEAFPAPMGWLFLFHSANCYFYIHMVSLCTVLLGPFMILKAQLFFICLFSIIFWLFPSIVIEENLLVRSSEGGKAGLETVKVADFRTSLCCTQKANSWAHNLFVSFYWSWRLNSLWTLTELPVSFATETIFLLQETTESQHVPWQANFSISWAAILSQTLFLKMLVESSQKQNPNWPGVCIG